MLKKTLSFLSKKKDILISFYLSFAVHLIFLIFLWGSASHSGDGETSITLNFSQNTSMSINNQQKKITKERKNDQPKKQVKKKNIPQHKKVIHDPASYQVHKQTSITNEHLILSSTKSSDSKTKSSDSNIQKQSDGIGRSKLSFNPGRARLKLFDPRYPQSSRKKGHTGIIIVKFWVAPNGSVVRAFPIRTTGHTEIDIEATRAVKEWQFEAILSANMETGTVTYHFELTRNTQ